VHRAIIRCGTLLAAAAVVLLCATGTVAQRIQFSSPLPNGNLGNPNAGATAGPTWTPSASGPSGVGTSGQASGPTAGSASTAPAYPPAGVGGNNWYSPSAAPSAVGGATTGVGTSGAPAVNAFATPPATTAPAGSAVAPSPVATPQSVPAAPGWSSAAGSGTGSPWSGTVPSYPPNYYGTPPAYNTPPSSTLNGQIQPVGPTWDPYQPPGAAPATLLPQDPSFQFGAGEQWAGTMQKFLQEIRLDYLWMPGNGGKEIGINDIGLSATFALPFFYNTQTPLLVTPGFAIHCWSGPETLLPGPPPPADLPGQTYDAYLDAAWNPQPTPLFGAELNFRIGVGADFKKVTTRSLRFTGKGLAVLNLSPSFQLKGGVIYYDRVHLKLLPAGGVVWTPTQDWRFDIVFPYPRVTKKLNAVGTTEWWLYFAGSYPNGGAWTIKRADEADVAIAGQIDLVDYTDMRVAAGLEFRAINNVRGFVESGVAFERQLHYRSDLPDVFYGNVTVFLHAGLAY